MPPLIEAARAQEHGKAFSVVAAEVRKLSDITKKAAEEINKLARSSLDISKKAGDMLATLIPSIHKTSDLVQDISAASGEQSSGAEHINTAIQQLDQVTQQNAASAENIATMASELAAQSEQLNTIMAFFVVENAETEPPGKKKTPAPKSERTSKVSEGIEREHDSEKPLPVKKMLDLDIEEHEKNMDVDDDDFEPY